MVSSRWPFVFALAACLTAVPSAQQNFRTASNIVAVDASVYDKNGQPVTNLTAADFQIFEDGKLQPVETIYLVTPDIKSTGSLGTGAPVHPGTSAPASVLASLAAPLSGLICGSAY